MTWATTDLYDEFAGEVRTSAIQFSNYGKRRQFCGPVRTLRCFEDNVLLRQMLESKGGGSVLVVDGGGSTAVAVMGDRIGAMAARNGWAGVVLNAAVRDSKALATIDLGIRAIGTNPARSRKVGAGERDVAIELGNAEVFPGYWLYADEDGLLLASRNLLE